MKGSLKKINQASKLLKNCFQICVIAFFGIYQDRNTFVLAFFRDPNTILLPRISFFIGFACMLMFESVIVIY